MKPYYYVYRRGHGPPRVKHDTLESARSEAERLASSHPGEALEILKCVAVSSASEISTFWIEAERLASSHPGEALEILKCVAVSSASEISTFWMDGEGPSTVAKSATVQPDKDGWIEYKQGDPIPTEYRQVKVSTGEIRHNLPHIIWDRSFWIKDSAEDCYYITHYKP